MVVSYLNTSVDQFLADDIVSLCGSIVVLQRT